MTFKKGQIHQETPEQKQHRIVRLTEAWKDREDYTNGLRGTPFHNSWRSVRFTLKGKKAGCDPKWLTFQGFQSDMQESFKDGCVLVRADKSKPYSKSNCFWTPKGQEVYSKSSLVKLTHQNKTQTLKEWAVELGISLNGLRLRYHKGEDYSVEEILFGKMKVKRKWNTEASVKIRASKLLATYRNNDNRRGYENNLKKDWFISNILSKPCHYCNSTDRIGSDRIINSKGHTMDNVVPCCYNCNVLRGDRFTVAEMLKIGKVVREIMEDRKIKNN
jgi:hypothetical protein